MNKFFIFICIATTILTAGNDTYGQEKSEKLSLTMDVASGFIWRGLALNTSPVIQPSLTFAPGKFSIGTWASTPFTADAYQEVDLFVNYRFTSFLSIGVTDYFGHDNLWQPPSYFNYNRGETTHAFDAQLIFSGVDKFPLKAMISTIIAGADLNDRGKNNFSTYVELGYGNTCRGVDWEVFTGIVPMKSGFYGIEKGGVTNFGLGVSRSFEITPTYSLPLSLKFVVNPAVESVYLTAAISLF